MNYTKMNLNVCQCYIVLIKKNYIQTALENLIIATDSNELTAGKCIYMKNMQTKH